MRVERLTVSGFGKLAGSDLRPGPGLTVVHGPNESGKSTTHAALRASLFGLVAGGRRTRDETAAIERNRPWLEARYGSVLELAEACRVPVRWSCRTGVCHTCETGLVSGEVDYEPEPIDRPALGNVLVCCARPLDDLVVDL